MCATGQKKHRIIVVDDEPHQIDTVCRGLFLNGFECIGADSVEQALTILERDGKFDLLLTDLTMPGHSGFTLIETVRHRYPRLPVVVFTGLAPTSGENAIRLRGIPVLQKPFQPDTLVSVIEKCINEKPKSPRA